MKAVRPTNLPLIACSINSLVCTSNGRARYTLIIRLVLYTSSDVMNDNGISGGVDLRSARIWVRR